MIQLQDILTYTLKKKCYKGVFLVLDDVVEHAKNLFNLPVHLVVATVGITVLNYYFAAVCYYYKL